MKKIILLILMLSLLFTIGCGDDTENKTSNYNYANDSYDYDDYDYEGTTVYITKTGECYHRSGCSSLRKSKIKKDLSEVKGKYRPCSICDPPTTD